MTEVSPPVRRASRRAKVALVVVGVLVVVAIAAAVSVKAVVSASAGPEARRGVLVPGRAAVHPTLKMPWRRSRSTPRAISYVTDYIRPSQVWKLAAGADAPTPLPSMRHRRAPRAWPSTPRAAIYVTDGGHNRVLKLASGASEPIVLPFTGLKDPAGVAVDTAGNVYVADYNGGRVLKLAVAADAPQSLPLPGLKNPEGVESTRQATSTSPMTGAVWC